MKQFTAAARRPGDAAPRRGRSRAGGKAVDKLEALFEALFSWGALGWATAVLYGVFLLS